MYHFVVWRLSKQGALEHAPLDHHVGWKFVTFPVELGRVRMQNAGPCRSQHGKRVAAVHLIFSDSRTDSLVVTTSKVTR